MKKVFLGLIVLVVFVGTIIFINKPLSSNDSKQNVQNNKEKPNLGFETLQDKAKKGDSKAQNELGNLYANGSIEDPTNKAALKLFEQSANQGYAEAQYNLGTMYQNAIGVDQDLKKAVMYFKLAANQGHKEAKENLEIICEQDSTLCN